MSQNQLPIAVESFKASGVIVANTFVSGGPSAVATTGAGLTSNGVAISAAAIGDMVPVMTLGVAQVVAGAAIAENALVQSNATGQAITLAAGVALGRARCAVAALGQIVEVDLFKVIV